VGLARAGVEVCGVFRPLKKSGAEEKTGSTPRSRRNRLPAKAKVHAGVSNLRPLILYLRPRPNPFFLWSTNACLSPERSGKTLVGDLPAWLAGRAVSLALDADGDVRDLDTTRLRDVLIADGAIVRQG
jgi:hypothetical protein